MTNATIYCVDELLAKAGKGREVLSRYREEYAPAATARGMTLDRELVSPPMWLDEQANRLLITWRIAGAAAWWGVSSQSRFDPSVAAFWQSIDPLLESRNRYFASADADVAELSDV